MNASVAAGAQQAPEALSNWLSQKRQLPIPPSVFGRLMELGRRTDASPADYVEIITASAPLAGRLLAVVNSSWFGVRHYVRNIQQAVNLLGTVNVRLVAVTHCVAAAHEDVHLGKDIMDHHWRANLIKAVAAEHLACRLERRWGDDAFLLGLMQDMVMPVMQAICPDLYERGLAVWSPAQQCQAERERLGMDHAEAGAILAERYGLPPVLCQMLRSHHDRAALRELADRPVLAEAVWFAGLFPHAFAGWDTREARHVAALIGEWFSGSTGVIDEVLIEIQRRFEDVAECIRPAAGHDVDLPGLLRQATGEVADSTVSLVGQVHSLVSNAAQADSQLAAASVEAMHLQEQTQQDPLTGLLNRHGLDSAAQWVIGQAQRCGGAVAVLFADLDRFKSINDQFGHDVGDRVLQHVARLLADTFGPAATVGRYGGDEFVVILSGASSRQVKALAVGLLDAAAQGLAEDGKTIPIRLSIGGLWCPALTAGPDGPADAARPDCQPARLLAMADELMYRAKQQSGNQVVFVELTADGTAGQGGRA